jgi:hypothetical protein
MEPEKELMQFACSMSRSIDPRRPRKLTPEQSASIKDLPCIMKLAERVKKLSRALKGRPKKEKRRKEAHRLTLTGRVKKLPRGPEGSRTEEKYNRALKRLRSEKQRQRRLLLIDVKDRYKKEQPVRDSARQLSGKIVDKEVLRVLERSENMTPEHLYLIDAIMTLPETTLEKEVQRRIVAINAVTAYCGVEEGRSYRVERPGRPAGSVASTIVNAEGQVRSTSDNALRQAIASVRRDKRPKVCFLCLGSPRLSMDKRVREYVTVGSLTRHFLRHHVNKLQTGMQIDCQICDVKMVHRMDLLNHAETSHGTVTRVRT